MAWVAAKLPDKNNQEKSARFALEKWKTNGPICGCGILDWTSRQYEQRTKLYDHDCNWVPFLGGIIIMKNLSTQVEMENDVL